MDELKNRLSPTFSSAAVRQRYTSTSRTTMVGNGRGTLTNEATTPEKETPLIEEGFSEFVFAAAPPPRWLN
jgi:hypothetical protein